MFEPQSPLALPRILNIPLRAWQNTDFAIFSFSDKYLPVDTEAGQFGPKIFSNFRKKTPLNH